MGHTPDEFASLDTTTPGKLDTIRWQIENLGKVLKPSRNGICIGLPGTGKQCSRHCEEYMAYGFRQDRQVMVDRSAAVIRSQLDWKNRTRYQGTVLEGYLEEVMERLHGQGHPIDLVDYDDVANLEQRHEDFIANANQIGVRAIILVLTTRCSTITPYLGRWQDRLGIHEELSKDRNRPGRKEYSTPLARIQEEAIKIIASKNGYDIVHHHHSKHGLLPSRRYLGRSTMQSCLLFKG
jgi:hypothetical protein